MMTIEELLKALDAKTQADLTNLVMDHRMELAETARFTSFEDFLTAKLLARNAINDIRQRSKSSPQG